MSDTRAIRAFPGLAAMHRLAVAADAIGADLIDAADNLRDAEPRERAAVIRDELRALEVLRGDFDDLLAAMRDVCGGGL